MYDVIPFIVNGCVLCMHVVSLKHKEFLESPSLPSTVLHYMRISYNKYDIIYYLI